MSRWCDWSLNGIPMSIPQPDIFPEIEPFKCSGETITVTALTEKHKDKPVCERHIKRSQMYHSGGLRAVRVSPNLPRERWSQWDDDGDEFEWDSVSKGQSSVSPRGKQ